MELEDLEKGIIEEKMKELKEKIVELEKVLGTEFESLTLKYSDKMLHIKSTLGRDWTEAEIRLLKKLGLEDRTSCFQIPKEKNDEI